MNETNSKRVMGVFRAGHETRLALTAMLAGLPAAAFALFFSMDRRAFVRCMIL